jgi:hypothetical protein
MATFIDPIAVRAEFHYVPETGELIRDTSVWCRKKGVKGAKPGQARMHKSGQGKPYLRLGFGGKYIYAHRIIWVWMTGEQPQHIDHLDGNGLNNKWENIRSVSQAENMRNQKRHTSNSSGVGGIGYRKDSGRWRVRVSMDGRVRSLGTFSSFDEAVIARDQACAQSGYSLNHGKS